MMRLLPGALSVPLFSVLCPAMAQAAVQAADLIPAQMVLPAPWGIIKFLLIITFFIHIVLVNVLLGSSMLASINAWSRTPFKGYNLKQDTGFATGVLALAVNFGVAPFLFAQVIYGSFIYTGNLLMAVWWMSIPILVMLAYYALYIIKVSGPDDVFLTRLVIIANTLLLMLVAFFLSTSSRMASSPESWVGWLYRPGGTMLFLNDPSLAPRYLHVLAASLAVGGLFLAVRARWSLRRPGADAAEAEARVKYGMKFFIYASILQALSGLWYLFTLPAPVRSLFWGQSVLATGGLALAVTGLGAAIWAARAGMIKATAGFAMGIIFIMISIRDLVRDVLLSPYNQAAARQSAEEAMRNSAESGLELVPHIARQSIELPNPLPHGQWAAFAFFLFCAAIGLVTLFWLLRVAVKTFNGASGIREE